MTEYREILRLSNMGLSRTSIGASLGYSRNTVADVVNRAQLKGVEWPLPLDVTDGDLLALLYPEKGHSSSRKLPDCEKLHKEMVKSGVTLTLLWDEYCGECKQNAQLPFAYTQFCHYYHKYVLTTKATMHLHHKPGEQIEVDWAGKTANIIDNITGDFIPAYVFVAVLSCSGYAYVEAFLSQKQESWISAQEHPRNPRVHPDSALDKLVKSINEFGWTNPVLVSKDGYILAGHARCKAAQKAGLEEVPVIFLDLEGEKADAYLIADNKIQDETDWDIPLLTDLLKDLGDNGFDVSLTGFEAAEIDELFGNDNAGSNDVVEDDFDTDAAVAEIETPISQRGDIWLLGKHRLMCGDSTSLEDVSVLMDGKKARHVFTDPPWNVALGASNHPSWKPNRQILNDNMSTEEFKDFMLKVFTTMSAVSEHGCMTYVVMSAQEWGSLMNVMREAGYHWSSTIIWKKDSLVLSRKDYHTMYEPLWYGWLDGASRLCPLVDRKQSDVFDIPRPKRSELHPTTKPISLVARAICNSSHKGDLVLDLFGGSGTTLIAAEQTERVCHMMELDCKYVDVITKRYVEDTGDSSVFLLRNGEKTAYQDIQ